MSFDEDVFDGPHATRQIQADLAFRQAGDGAAIETEHMGMRTDFPAIVRTLFDPLVTPDVVS